MSTDLSFLIIRISLGLPLLLHGAQKLFGLCNGSGLKNWIDYITSQNIPMTNIKFPKFIAILAALIEFFGGLFILFGIYIKYAAIAVALFLLVAIKLVHCEEKGYFLHNGGFEYCLTLLLLSIVLIINGGGSYQLIKN